MKIKSFTELNKIKSFKERYEYLKLSGCIGEETFGFDRFLNQEFYRSAKWKKIRNMIIVRDCGCDLGMDGCEIYGKIIIHHMNPITTKDIRLENDFLLNPEYLITTSFTTHNAIHFGDENLIAKEPIVRSLNDTCPWKNGKEKHG